MKKYLPFIIVMIVLAIGVTYTLSHAEKSFSPSTGGNFDLGESDRAWKDLWLSGGIGAIKSIQFTTTATTTCSEGMVKWNDDDKTIDVCTENAEVTLQVGQEMHVRGTNKTGSTLTNGQVVYINGAQGSRPTFALANSTTEDESKKTIGIVTADIDNNGTGYVTTTGLVRDIDTSTMVVGNSVWLGTSPGSYTDILPVTPNHATRIGTNVLSHASEGIIYVSPQNGYELYEIHDVSNQTENAIANDILAYNGTAWINTADIFVNGITLGSSAPDWVAYKGGEYLCFDGGVASTESVSFNVQTPHERKDGTDIELHVHWVLEDNTSCNVVWDVTYSWANIGSAFPAQTAFSNTIASSGVTDEHTYSDLVWIDGTGKIGSSMLILSATRDATDAADTCDSKDACVLEFDLHYEVNRPGSPQEDPSLP
jgi:hypothetical protein